MTAEKDTQENNAQRDLSIVYLALFAGCLLFLWGLDIILNTASTGWGVSMMIAGGVLNGWVISEVKTRRR